MTQDEIIEMARKAWITSYCAAELKRGGVVDIDLENLEAFAKLVAAKEREACAKILETTDLRGLKDQPAIQDWVALLLMAYVDAIRAKG